MTRNDEIMAALDAGETLSAVARRFGVNASRVGQIRDNERRKAERARRWFGDMKHSVVSAIWANLPHAFDKRVDELTEAEAITSICSIGRAQWRRAPRLGKAGLATLEAWLEARGHRLPLP